MNKGTKKKVFVAMSPKYKLRLTTGQAGGKNKKSVFVAMSGGVDSSVAAYLLKKRNYDVVGIFMRCYNIDGCAERDAEDARRVAEKLNIPFYVWDFEEEYKKRVVDYMIEGYRRGITPNPDVMCNKEIKFGLFLQKALAAGADYVATGHYVGIRENPISSTRFARSSGELACPRGFGPVRGGTPSRTRCGVSGNRIFSLYIAKDKNKDQSYFLWTLNQEQLKHCLFPIGDYLKSEVREIARKAGLPTAEKKDSQGICFLGKVPLVDFLKQYIPERRGLVVTVDGDTIGRHCGAHFYTIGQRRGLNHEAWNMKLETLRGRSRYPFYVAAKDTGTNTVIVAEGSDNPTLYKKEIELVHVNFINPILSEMFQVSSFKLQVLARVRYRQALAPARFLIHGSRFKLAFDKPQKFVAPGQSAVFYAPRRSPAFAKASADMEMLGGGVIADAH